MTQWGIDADGQLVNMAHVILMRVKEMSDGAWSIMGDIYGRGPVCFARGLPDRDAANKGMIDVLRVTPIR